MKLLRSVVERFQIGGELVAFFWTYKRWWIIPMVVILLMVGALVLFAQSSAIAPFIYTLF